MPRVTPLLLGLIVAVACPAAFAWHHEGHHLIAERAVDALPDTVPAFFRAGAATIAHASLDPDLTRNPAAPQLNDANAPEHYLDYEALQGKALPAKRSQYLKLMGELNLSAQQAGFLPYSVTESTQQLMIAFAEHRKWPDNPYIRMKCLIYAGWLAHYAGDLVQPLHNTIHFDGRVVNGRSPHTGIHAKVDDLLYRYKPDDIAFDPAHVRAIDGDLFKAVLAEIDKTHALVDRVYELEPKLPGVKEKVELDPQVKDFALDRATAGVELTASLFLTAWEQSAKIVIPSYVDRAEQDK
ncbi:MAG: hypothetical protein GC159_04390 [Phycisphaera sp.]|nr:hypothetical protein [Phycisphaera sp.]